MTTTSPAEQAALCALTRWCFGASAVSLAVVEGDGLRYVAADGIGSDVIVGTLLPIGRGIAGFVAASGQSLTVSDPVADPRFARDVGERTGHIPSTIQCVPFHDDDGDVAGVITILDRTADTGPDVEDITSLASALTAHGDDRARSFDDRLARLPAAQRERAAGALSSVLELLER